MVAVLLCFFWHKSVSKSTFSDVTVPDMQNFKWIAKMRKKTLSPIPLHIVLALLGQVWLSVVIGSLFEMPKTFKIYNEIMHNPQTILTVATQEKCINWDSTIMHNNSPTIDQILNERLL